ncbi:MAG TPA: nuclear transport factor 2 family protein [Deltaproteobacteria bacterium]|nr:nuclear transport factor 2 family protein [Deltaproteobacteria bacterium]
MLKDPDIRSLLDERTIRHILARYCRGLDRMDKDMAYSSWHPDATAVYDGLFEGSGHDFIDWAWKTHAELDRHFHQINNTVIELSGDRATSEAYVTVVVWTKPDEKGDQVEIITRGRYLDRWDRRMGVWAINHRTYLTDMQTIHPLAPGSVSSRSTRDQHDPSFDFIPRG